MINKYINLFKKESVGLGLGGHPIDQEIAKLKSKIEKAKTAGIEKALVAKIILLERAKKMMNDMAENGIEAVKKVKKNERKAYISIDKNVVREMASYGLNKTLIAQCLGVKLDTFSKRLREDAELEQYFNKGRAEGVLENAKLLRDAAQAGSVPAMIFYLKTQAGEAFKETQHVEHKVHTHESKLLTLEADYVVENN